MMTRLLVVLTVGDLIFFMNLVTSYPQMHCNKCYKQVCCQLHLESSRFRALLAQSRAPLHVARYFNFLSAQPKFASVSGTWNKEKAVRDNSSPVGQVLNYS